MNGNERRCEVAAIIGVTWNLLVSRNLHRRHQQREWQDCKAYPKQQPSITSKFMENGTWSGCPHNWVQIKIECGQYTAFNPLPASHFTLSEFQEISYRRFILQLAVRKWVCICMSFTEYYMCKNAASLPDSPSPCVCVFLHITLETHHVMVWVLYSLSTQPCPTTRISNTISLVFTSSSVLNLWPSRCCSINRNCLQNVI
jgi:hypothetical protein